MLSFFHLPKATGEVEDSMSQDIALKMYQRDRHRAQALFKHSPTLSKSASLEGDHLLHRFEPDWSKFEHVYAHGEWTLRCLVLIEFDLILLTSY